MKENHVKKRSAFLLKLQLNNGLINPFSTDLQTEKGEAFHFKTDVFKRLLWYGYRGETGLIALSPERVKEIIKMNKEGVKPKDLLEIVKIEKIVELGYSNVVGQDSLTRFDKPKSKNNRKRNKGKSKNRYQTTNKKPNQNRKPKKNA